MSLAHHDIDISWLSVAEEMQSTSSLRGLYSGGRFERFGRMMFEMNTTLNVKKDFCPFHGDGCQCGNQHKNNIICATTGAKCPVQPQCSSNSIRTYK